MNWDDVRVFLAVARGESLSRAAPVLKMDVATVSRRIARLEESIGGTLFVKSPSGYAMTELGSQIFERAVGAEDVLSQAFDEGQFQASGLRGQIRIGAPDGCANFLLPQVCARIREENPELEMQILALPRVVNLSKREADIAITVSPPQAGRLLVQKITDYHLHLAMRSDEDVPKSKEDLRARTIVGYIPDMIFDSELDYLGELGTGAVQMASNSVAVQLQMLRQGGIGFVHDFALPFAPELVRTLTNAVSLKRSFYLVRHAADRRSERMRQIAGLLQREIRSEVESLEALVP